MRVFTKKNLSTAMLALVMPVYAADSRFDVPKQPDTSSSSSSSSSSSTVNDQTTIIIINNNNDTTISEPTPDKDSNVINSGRW